MKILRITFISVLMSLVCFGAWSQQRTVTLSEALNGARKNYPLLKQKNLLKQSGEKEQQLLSASLLPQLNVTGQATYQSEVTSLDVPGFPKGIGQKPDNYDIGLEMRIPLTSFSTVHTRRELERAQTQIEMSQVDADWQQLRERITTLMGNILLQQENENILLLRVNDLDSQRRKVTVGVNNGAVLKSNQLILESELLSSAQKIDDVRATIRGLVDELALLSALSIDSATRFQLDGELITDKGFDSLAVNRAEIRTIHAQRQVLDLKTELLKKESRPHLFVFGQGYYGRPGYNFLNTKMRPYGIAGIGLSWSLNNVLNRSKEQEVLEINKTLLDRKEETFLLNLKAALAQKNAEIEKYRSIISRDAQIVDKRRQIIRAVASQLSNGIITSTEYLTELNAQTAAELNMSLHRIQLAVAQTQYKILSGY